MRFRVSGYTQVLVPAMMGEELRAGELSRAQRPDISYAVDHTLYTPCCVFC